ncbi:MAG: hypothetical protein HQL56_06005 [Magnetococcales bacterium]|nr:hypothetical protein [Magnetococcales bacterium]
MATTEEMLEQVVQLTRGNRPQEAGELISTLVQEAPETVAQWYLLGRLLSVGGKEIEDEIERRLGEYGQAPARAWRKALNAMGPLSGRRRLLQRLETLLHRVQQPAPPPSGRALQRLETLLVQVQRQRWQREQPSAETPLRAG